MLFIVICKCRWEQWANIIKIQKNALNTSTSFFLKEFFSLFFFFTEGKNYSFQHSNRMQSQLPELSFNCVVILINNLSFANSFKVNLLSNRFLFCFLYIFFFVHIFEWQERKLHFICMKSIFHILLSYAQFDFWVVIFVFFQFSSSSQSCFDFESNWKFMSKILHTSLGRMMRVMRIKNLLVVNLSNNMLIDRF